MNKLANILAFRYEVYNYDEYALFITLGPTNRRTNSEQWIYKKQLELCMDTYG